MFRQTKEWRQAAEPAYGTLSSSQFAATHFKIGHHWFYLRMLDRDLIIWQGNVHSNSRNGHLGPLLPTWFNFNPNMDK